MFDSFYFTSNYKKQVTHTRITTLHYFCIIFGSTHSSMSALLYLLHQSAFHLQDPHVSPEAEDIPSPMWPWLIGSLEGKADCITFCGRSTWVKPTALRIWGRAGDAHFCHRSVIFGIFLLLSAYVCIVKSVYVYPLKSPQPQGYCVFVIFVLLCLLLKFGWFRKTVQSHILGPHTWVIWSGGQKLPLLGI